MLFELTDEGPIFRWEQVFTLLSLERVDPFWRNMGLNIAPSESLHVLARNFVTEYHTLQVKFPGQENRRTFLAASNSLLGATFDLMTSQEGDLLVQALYEWETTSFYSFTRERKPSDNWQTVLFRLLTGEGPNTPIAPLELSTNSSQVLLTILGKYLSVDWELGDRLDEALGDGLVPTSAWEQYLDTHSKHDITLRDKLAIVPLQISFISFRAAWNEITKFLTQDELKALVDWGKKQSELMGMDSKYIDALQFRPTLTELTIQEA